MAVDELSFSCLVSSLVNIQCIRKVFRPLQFFHILLRYSLILNGLKQLESSSICTQYPIMTKQKQVFRHFCTFDKKSKTEISHLHKYSDPLLNTLLKHLWQRLHPWVFLGMTLQAWHTCIWGVSPILCRLDGERCYTAIFRPLQRCLIGFKSRLWLGHSRTFRDLSRSHSCLVLAVCLRSLSC